MLIGITGQMGSGKTLLMTILGKTLSQVFDVPLFSNYSVLGAERIYFYNQLWEIEKAIILLDEVWLNIDARFWGKNVYFTRWINQTRKKNVLVFYTTQHFSQVDVRLRRGTDLLIWCFKYPQFFYFVLIDPTTERILKTLKLEKEKAIPFFSLYNSFEIILPLKGKKGRPKKT